MRQEVDKLVAAWRTHFTPLWRTIHLEMGLRLPSAGGGAGDPDPLYDSSRDYLG